MKKFILKTILFSIPILALFLSNAFFGAEDKGDLLRIGYLFDNTGYYRDTFKNAFTLEIKYVDFSNQKKQDGCIYKIFTIGDSFSQQGNSGYQNYLASDSINSVLHFNSWGNPMEMLNGVTNGDILDSIKVDFIIFQCAERYIIERGTNFDSAFVINYKTAVERDRKMKISVEKKELDNQKINLFSDAVIKFPLYNFLYLFDDNAFYSDVYRINLKDKVFSVDGFRLLFYFEEIKNVISNNDLGSVKYLNFELNKLSQILGKRGIKLIVLISPDKFDIYYSNVVNKEQYPKPLFFDYFNSLSKEYIYIDTKGLLLNAISHKKDIYYFDDTHWSPFAAQLIADKIKESIELDNHAVNIINR